MRVTTSSAEAALVSAAEVEVAMGAEAGTAGATVMREVATEAAEGATPTATAALPTRALACG